MESTGHRHNIQMAMRSLTSFSSRSSWTLQLIRMLLVSITLQSSNTTDSTLTNPKCSSCKHPKCIKCWNLKDGSIDCLMWQYTWLPQIHECATSWYCVCVYLCELPCEPHQHSCLLMLYSASVMTAPKASLMNIVARIRCVSMFSAAIVGRGSAQYMTLGLRLATPGST